LPKPCQEVIFYLSSFFGVITLPKQKFYDLFTHKQYHQSMAIPIYTDLHLIKKRDEFIKQDRNHNKSPPITLISKKTDKSQEQLQNLVISSQKILIKMDTVWPIDFFKDTLIVDPLKITYTHRTFFMIAYTESILIEDIIEADVELSPLFATLRVSFVSYPTRQILIKPLWKKQAEYAREMIAGLRVAHRQNLKVEKLPIEQVTKLGELANPTPEQ
jgi:hypothetical protein